MPLTNAETQARLKARKTAAYDLLKGIAQNIGFMAHSKDAEGFDQFMAAIDAEQLKVRVFSNGDQKNNL